MCKDVCELLSKALYEELSFFLVQTSPGNKRASINPKVKFLCSSTCKKLLVFNFSNILKGFLFIVVKILTFLQFRIRPSIIATTLTDSIDMFGCRNGCLCSFSKHHRIFMPYKILKVNFQKLVTLEIVFRKYSQILLAFNAFFRALFFLKIMIYFLKPKVRYLRTASGIHDI